MLNGKTDFETILNKIKNSNKISFMYFEYVLNLVQNFVYFGTFKKYIIKKKEYYYIQNKYGIDETKSFMLTIL